MMVVPSRWRPKNEESHMSDENGITRKEPEIFEHTVGANFLPAIFNGDESGLEEEDCEKLAEWMKREEFDLRYGHFSYGDEPETHFATCEVTGLQGDVVDLHWVQMVERP